MQIDLSVFDKGLIKKKKNTPQVTHCRSALISKEQDTLIGSKERPH